MKAKQITKDVYWVGGIDWDLRDFHGYKTQKGSSYNAYLIIDEKITLIDNVKGYLTKELIERIENIIPVEKIDYFVQNHIEMDHSGALVELLKRNSKAKVYISSRGEKNINDLFDIPTDRLVGVKTGESLSIGKRTLQFLETPMVHWPDNMVTYLVEDKILFSNDAFGQHIASSERIDEDYNFSDFIMQEAKKYYANIVLCYSAQVQRALGAVKNLQPKIIAPSHGIIWKRWIPEILAAYQNWSTYQINEKKAVIIYDTMWDSTKKLALAIMEVFEEKGFFANLLSLQNNHISDIMTEILDSKYIFVGSPTLNKQPLPSIAAFMVYLKGLAPKQKTAFSFGSYGWGSGESIKILEKELSECKFDMAGSFKVKNIPTKQSIQELKKIISEII